MFILPFIEAQAVYSDCCEPGINLFGKRNPSSSNNPAATDSDYIRKSNGSNTEGIDDTLKAKLAIPTYTCPASRAGSPKYMLGDLDASGNACNEIGPRTGYVILTAKDDFKSGTERFYCLYSSNAANSQNKFVGTFKIPTLTMNRNGNISDVRHGRYIADWTYSKDFSWWSNGRSNQLCLGEKHIPSMYREATTGNQVCWDGAYSGVTHEAAGSLMARVVNNERADLFARSPSGTFPTSPGVGSTEGANQLGSSHSGIVNFLVGDGSVHSMPVTTLPLLVSQLTVVNDDNAASLP